MNAIAAPKRKRSSAKGATLSSGSELFAAHRHDWVRYPARIVSESNARGHWAGKARRAKQQRGLAANVLRAHFVARYFGGPLVIELSRVAPRLLDDDNLRGALKATRDGVADWLGIKDNDPRVEWRYAQLKGKPREYGVHIIVERPLPVMEVRMF